MVLSSESKIEEPPYPRVEELVMLFNRCFREAENTVLQTGADEPIYLPAHGSNGEHVVVSTKDYFASALHEISHWCIAGPERRLLEDYGYWYEPDGRTNEQQAEFERVEVKPQALEWLFTEACGLRFRVSADNLDNPDAQVSEDFKHNVANEAQRFINHALKGRALVFFRALMAFYRGEGDKLSESDFSIDKLGANA